MSEIIRYAMALKKCKEIAQKETWILAIRYNVWTDDSVSAVFKHHDEIETWVFGAEHETEALALEKLAANYDKWVQRKANRSECQEPPEPTPPQTSGE